MPVRFEELRRDGWQALEGLAEHLPADDYYGDLGNALNVAADAFDQPYLETLGLTVVDEQEATLMYLLWNEWDRVRVVVERIHGPNAADDLYRASPWWPQVAAAAHRARTRMSENGVIP